jgi:hypothetical protein
MQKLKIDTLIVALSLGGCVTDGQNGGGQFGLGNMDLGLGNLGGLGGCQMNTDAIGIVNLPLKGVSDTGTCEERQVRTYAVYAAMTDALGFANRWASRQTATKGVITPLAPARLVAAVQGTPAMICQPMRSETIVMQPAYRRDVAEFVACTLAGS